MDAITMPLQLRIDWRPQDPEAQASTRYTAALQLEHNLEQQLHQARLARAEAFENWREIRYEKGA